MNKKVKILLVFGTRPESIKMAPLYIKAKEYGEIELKICVTAQHRQMLDQVLSFFDIVPDYDLNLMKPNQNLYNLTADVLVGLKSVLEDYQPHYLFVHGDTTTSMAASIAGFYNKTKVVHIEAGLRTYDKSSPFPEEINRNITGRIADIHFAPTQQSKLNLLRENIEAKNISVTGNTVIDALLHSIQLTERKEYESIKILQREILQDKNIILVTGHRRENFGDGFLQICEALKCIAESNQHIQIVYPVHLNPNVQKPVFEMLSKVKNIKLIAPQPYEAFIWLMNACKIVITDSGGVQEEAPSLGKPVLVMRDTTERPEAVVAGTVKLVGTNKDKIIAETSELLTNQSYYNQMSHCHNPYGDGNACERIFDFILYGKNNEYGTAN